MAPVPPAASVPTGGDDWTTYGSNTQRSGDNLNETALSPQDASELRQVWSTRVNHTILGSLIVANQTVYVGSRSGYLVGLNGSTGSVLTPTSPHPWETPYLGNTSYSRCGGSSGPGTRTSGIIATPTLVGNRLYESGGNTSLYTLSLNGQIVQRVDVANKTSKYSPWYFDYNWASPLVYRGMAYVGVAAICEFNDGDPNSADWKYLQGQLVEVNLTSGTVAAVFNVTKGTSVSDLGGSIWSTALADPLTNTVWVTTGNENNSAETPANHEYPRSTVALNATTLAVIGACQVGSVGVDNDFGAGPTLFTDGKGGRYVGALNKDGTFTAYNASVPSGGNCGAPGTGNLRFAWSDSFCAGTTPGTISPAAFDGHYLYIASDGCTNSSGYVDQVSPSNGAIRWSHSIFSPSGEAHAGVTVADGLVVIAANQVSSGVIGNGLLQVLNASNGALLFHAGFPAETNAWPVVADGTIFVTAGNVTNSDPGFVYAFRVPLSARASVGDASCDGPPVTHCVLTGETASLRLDATGGEPPFACDWQFGDSTSGSGCGLAHRYPFTGTYPVVGTLTDAAGSSSTIRLNLTVSGSVSNSVGPAPVARSGGVFAYDAADNVTILFGGVCDLGPCAGRFLNDTWEFSEGLWTNLTGQLSPAPPPIAYAAAAYNPLTEKIEVFGGETPNGSGPPRILATTWEFGHLAWTNVTSALIGSPPPLAGASATFDPKISAILLFGGFSGRDTGAGRVTNGTWMGEFDSWVPIASSPSPPGRGWAGIWFDRADSQLVLFGGRDGAGALLNDTWAFTGAGWRVVGGSSGPPPGDSFAFAAAGTDSGPVLWDPSDPGHTWEYSSGSWALLNASGHPSAVGAEAEATTVTDPAFDLLLVGNATWAYRNLTWAAIPPSVTIGLPATGVTAGVPAVVSALPSDGLPPFRFAWNAPGGSPASGTGENLSVTFAAAGTYTISLTVVDSLGEGANTRRVVDVGDALAVSFPTFPTAAEAGTSTTFSAGTSGGVGQSTLYWAFGDGSPTAEGPSVSHTYASGGTYRVNVTAVDAIDEQASVNASLLVAPPVVAGPVRGFPPSDAGQSVSFVPDLSGGIGPYELIAFFGDGSSTAEEWNGGTPTPAPLAHTYPDAGSYNLTLSVTDSLNAGATSSRPIVVNATLGTPTIVGPGSADPGAPSQFDARVVGGSAPFVVLWSFGDGTHESGSTVVHSYGASGYYLVSLTVTDAAGETAHAEVSINIGGSSAPALWAVLGLVAVVVGVVVGLGLARARRLRRSR